MIFPQSRQCKHNKSAAMQLDRWMDGGCGEIGITQACSAMQLYNKLCTYVEVGFSMMVCLDGPVQLHILLKIWPGEKQGELKVSFSREFVKLKKKAAGNCLPTAMQDLSQHPSIYQNNNLNNIWLKLLQKNPTSPGKMTKQVILIWAWRWHTGRQQNTHLLIPTMADIIWHM